MYITREFEKHTLTSPTTSESPQKAPSLGGAAAPVLGLGCCPAGVAYVGPAGACAAAAGKGANALPPELGRTANADVGA